VKVLFTGSRDWTDRILVQTAFTQFSPSLVIHGDARGLDTIADHYAEQLGIDRIRCPANWKGRGKAAGMYRNRFMYDLTQPDLVLAFPLPHSRGTWGMIAYARAQQCPRVLVWGEDF
jgi:hypothetical protein